MDAAAYACLETTPWKRGLKSQGFAWGRGHCPTGAYEVAFWHTFTYEQIMGKGSPQKIVQPHTKYTHTAIFVKPCRSSGSASRSSLKVKIKSQGH